MALAPMVYVLIFLAVLLAVEGVGSLMSERRTGARATARKRLRQIAMGIQSPDVQSEDSILRARREVRQKLVDFTRWVPGGAELERRLYQAGLTITPSQFTALCVAVGVAAWLVATVVFYSPSTAFPFLLAGLLPFAYIARLRSQRMHKFEEQFPEALDLITRAMRAGHSLTFGFQMVGDELPDPIGSEFAQVADEIKLGRELRVALGNLVYRVEAGDLPFFVTAITIQRETGGNLAEVLEKLGTLIRDRFALYGKVRALTAIGKASANLLASMPFLLVGLLYTCGGEGGRSYVEPLYTTTAGMFLSAGAVGMVTIGYILCRRMAVIEV
jgi:tight adherence protein B